MSRTIKALVVLGTAFVLAACAQQEAPMDDMPMVMDEPMSDGKM